jgi:uncharacterized membrane protein YqgA involved in biofilm formation
MKAADIIATIEKGVKFAESIAPIAAVIGGPIVGTVFNTVKAIKDVVGNVVDRANEAGEVFSTDDQAKIQELVRRLAAQNDKLAEAIANS